MRRFALFLIAAIPVLLAGIAAIAWLSQFEWDWTPQQQGITRSPLYERAKLFWEGAPAEVYSHWLGMLACSGGFAALQWLLLAERTLRRDAICWRGSWTLIVGGGLVGALWLACIALDRAKGEGVEVLAIPIFYAPLLVSAIVPLHLLSCRLRPMADAAVTVLATSIMVRAQLIFEPSQNGAPNMLILNAEAIVLALLAAPALASTARLRRMLREGGYEWVSWLDAVFAMLNGLRPRRLPPHAEVATLPGYRDGDIRALCVLARAS